jgi:hypothetical protein
MDKKPRGFWTKKECRKEALKYSCKIDFKMSSRGAYNACLNNNWLDKYCKHMEKLKLSLGEERIRKFLIRANIEFEEQKKFDNCININLLPFDFYITEFNTCIEYDGIHHFKPVKYFGGLERFKYTKKNDLIKNNFCIENNIRLIRIPYFKIKKIDNILKRKFLYNLNLEF